MKHKLFVSAAFSMSMALVLLPHSGQSQAAPGALVEQSPEEQSRIAEMMRHQRAMDIVLARLQADVQAVVNSKDANGYVHDKPAIKTYRGDLDALRLITSQHKQFAVGYERWCGQSFTTDYAHWCGPDVKQNAMAGHQQHMKTILFILSDTFNTYVAADNHSIEGGPNKIEDSLDAHRDALNQFAQAIKDHEGAISQMMTQGEVLIPELPLSRFALSPLPEKR